MGAKSLLKLIEDQNNFIYDFYLMQGRNITKRMYQSMKKKELEMILQKIPSYQKPRAELEQYTTPANIAADILYNAYMQGDILDKVIGDFGCGTGVFSIGAKLLGAKRVVGIDIDADGVEIARDFSKKLNLDVEYFVRNIGEVGDNFDVIFQNPPFGAQRRHADRVFLKKAINVASVVYTIHQLNTEDFITKLINDLGGKIAFKKRYIFPIKHMFEFHKKEKVDIEVMLFRIEK